jgi:hypothetical protein
MQVQIIIPEPGNRSIYPTVEGYEFYLPFRFYLHPLTALTVFPDLGIGYYTLPGTTAAVFVKKNNNICTAYNLEGARALYNKPPSGVDKRLECLLDGGPKALKDPKLKKAISFLTQTKRFNLSISS